MVTPLSVYATNTASTTLSTARNAVAVTGASGNTASQTVVGNQTGWVQIWSEGNASLAQFASMQSPNGHGVLWDVTTLEGQQIVAGTWTPIFRTDLSVGTATVDLVVAVYIYNAGTYTSIGTCTLSGQSITSTVANFTFTGTSLSAATFGTGDKLYTEWWYNITTNGTGSTTATAAFSTSNSSTQGKANAEAVTTPGYQLAPVALSVEFDGLGSLAPTLSASTALTGEWDGVGVLTPTLSATTALVAEWDGVGPLAATFSATFALSATLAGIGSFSASMTVGSTLSLPSTVLSGVGALAGAITGPLGTATLSGAGTLTVATPALSTALSVTLAGTGTLTVSSPALTTALTIISSSAGNVVGSLSAALTLTGGILVGLGTISGVAGLSVALVETLVGIGTLAVASPALAAALSVTMAGVGALSGVLSTTASVALTATFSGTGTLSVAAPSLATMLTVTLAGMGTLAGTPTWTTSLSVTLIGVGAVSGALGTTSTVPLSCVCSGLGVLSATGSFAQALSGGSAASNGTLSGAMTLSEYFAASWPGIGTASWSITASLLLPAPGTLNGFGALLATGAYGTTITVTLTGTGALAGSAVYAKALAGGLLASVGALAASGTYALTLTGGVASGTSSFVGSATYNSWLSAVWSGTGGISGSYRLGAYLSALFAGFGASSFLFREEGPPSAAVEAVMQLLQGKEAAVTVTIGKESIKVLLSVVHAGSNVLSGTESQSPLVLAIRS